METLLLIALVFAILIGGLYAADCYERRLEALKEHEDNGDYEPNRVVSLVPSPDSSYPSARVYTAIFVDEQGRLRREPVEATSLWEAKWLAMRDFHWPDGLQVL